MKNKVLLYRIQEKYSVFFDETTDKYVKLQHREQNMSSSIKYVFLFLFMLYFPKFLNSYYQFVSGRIINIFCLGVAGILSSVLSKKYLNQYYLVDNVQPLYLNKDFFVENINLGKKQLCIETCTVVIVLSFSILTSILFFTFSNLHLLSICFISYFILSIYIYMKPIKRKKILQKITSGDD